MTNSTPANQTILIVDDNPTNIGLLAEYLEEQGFTILVARDGESGLEKANYAQPDLILLDVMMTGISGFETCLQLKQNEKTKSIPVIFMTALNDLDHKVRGFAVGAVDYVTKPLQQEEVLARVTTHLRIQALTSSLVAANQDLQQLNADKDKFLSIMAHDLRGPFLPLLGSAELLATRADKLSREKIADMSLSIHQAAQRVMDLLNNLLQWGRLQMGRAQVHPRRLDLPMMVQQNLNLVAANAQLKQITLDCHAPANIKVIADENMVHFILRNLLSNALKFTPPGGQVTVSVFPLTTAQGAVAVRDTGVGMSQQALQNLFKIDRHQSTLGTNQEAGTGLGLILCEEMIKRNQGEIWVESEPGAGTTVTISLPLADATA